VFRQKGKASPSAPPPKYATERYGIDYNQAKVPCRPPVAIEPEPSDVPGRCQLDTGHGRLTGLATPLHVSRIEDEAGALER